MHPLEQRHYFKVDTQINIPKIELALKKIEVKHKNLKIEFSVNPLSNIFIARLQNADHKERSFRFEITFNGVLNFYCPLYIDKNTFDNTKDAINYIKKSIQDYILDEKIYSKYRKWEKGVSEYYNNSDFD